MQTSGLLRAWGCGRERETKGREGTFPGDGYAHDPDLGFDFTGAYVRQNTPSDTI